MSVSGRVLAAFCLAMAVVGLSSCRRAIVEVTVFDTAKDDAPIVMGAPDWQGYRSVSLLSAHGRGSRLYIPYVRYALIPWVRRAGEPPDHFREFVKMARSDGADLCVGTHLMRYSPTYNGYPFSRVFIGGAASGSDGWVDMMALTVRRRSGEVASTEAP